MLKEATVLTEAFRESLPTGVRQVDYRYRRHLGYQVHTELMKAR